MSFKTDYGRVAGLGSAKDGTHHFWAQRVSAVALLILTPLFVFPLAYNMGDSFDNVRAAYAHPINAIVVIRFDPDTGEIGVAVAGRDPAPPADEAPSP